MAIPTRTYRVVTLPGDGIGPEVIAIALEVLEAVGNKLGFMLEVEEHLIGGAAIDATGNPFPDVSREACQDADAVLLGAVGGPAWDHLTGPQRPESGLLALRKTLGAFANLRPVAVPKSMAASSPLKEEIVQGTDLLIVRELTGGIYFGEPRGIVEEAGGRKGFNTMVYSEDEIRRIAEVAFTWARRRKGKVTLVDKANVLDVSQLWRQVVPEYHQAAHPEIELHDLYVDNAAMQMVLNPGQFDVVLTGNLFGDILSDLAATLPGSLGMLPSASVGGKVGIFEPVHGSAPDIAGQNLANPLAMVLSAAMMLDALNEQEGSAVIRKAVDEILEAGYRTGDMWQDGYTKVGTKEMGAHLVHVAQSILQSELAS